MSFAKSLVVALCLLQGVAGDVQDIIDRMTSEEKYTLMNGISGNYVGQTPNVTRVGIPSLNLQDAGQGFRTFDERNIGEVTSWSCSLGLASVWDPELVFKWASASSAEFKDKGANVVLGPGLNVHRVASGGRNAEYLSGEDPFLGASLAGQYVDGYQSNGIIAVMKHFALNNQETLRDTVNAIIPDARALWEIYYPPYQACVDAGVGSVMCSYNLVNGSHSCENEQLLVRDLRETMGFDGFVMSDWGATHSTQPELGLDMDMEGNDGYYSAENLAGVSDDVINDVMTHILNPMERVGLLDSTVCTVNYDCDSYMYDVNASTSEHIALAQDIATQSVLLLKNANNTLPIESPAVKKIAVVGSACAAENDIDAMLAQWNIGNYYVIGGSGRVIPPSVVTIADGIGALAGDIEVVYSLEDDLDAATEAISDADIVITCGGATSTESVDRSTLLLDQDEFISNLANATDVPMVVAVMSPGVWVGEWVNDVDAVVNIYLGGQATGNAIASVLFGESNPHAKSPVTYPLSEDDVIAPCTTVDCEYSEGLVVGYRRFDQLNMEVQFPFGHGLSYTSFDYEFVSIEQSSSEITMSVLVTNSGDRLGCDVAQLYVQFPSSASMPPKALKGFQRTQDLAPGESQTITFSLSTEDDLKMWDNNAWGWSSVTGEFVLHVGASSRDIRFTQQVTV